MNLQLNLGCPDVKSSALAPIKVHEYPLIEADRQIEAKQVYTLMASVRCPHEAKWMIYLDLSYGLSEYQNCGQYVIKKSCKKDIPAQHRSAEISNQRGQQYKNG